MKSKNLRRPVVLGQVLLEDQKQFPHALPKKSRVERRPSKLNTDIICFFAILVDVCICFCIGAYNCHIHCVVTMQRKKGKAKRSLQILT